MFCINFEKMLRVFIYLFIFYIPWIFWDKPHLDIGIVNIDMNMLCNVMVCML